MTSAMVPAEIRNQHGERIAYTFTPGSIENRDIVVIGHGCTSDKERPWSIGLSDALAEHGIASLRIAFSGNGDSEGRFEDCNITKGAADLGSVFDALDAYRASYVGHSMGASIGAVCVAARPRVHALVSLAGVTHTTEFMDRMFGDTNPGEAMLGKPQCPFNEALRADFHALHSLVDRAPSISVRWLLVHGTADDIVGVEHSRDMHAEANAPAELVELEGVDHSFTGEGLPKMIDTVVPWLVRRLNHRERT